MARQAITDYLQAFPFWMMDVANVSAGAFPVFNPALGFASISAPEISLDTMAIREANWYFDRKVLQRGNINSFTVRRAVSFSDSDFWRWTMAGLTGGTQFSVGGPSYRRTLMLVHFFARNPLGGGPEIDPTSVARAAALAVKDPDNAADYRRQVQYKEAGVGGAASFGPFEFAIRVPAKAYLLKGCLPGRWRSGSDFDAMDGSVSIAELDFSCEMVEEVSLAGTYGAAIASAVGPVTTALEALTSIL